VIKKYSEERPVVICACEQTDSNEVGSTVGSTEGSVVGVKEGTIVLG